MQTDIYARRGIRTHNPSSQKIARALELTADEIRRMLQHANEVLLDIQRP
jgi:DNA-directed RNA polymerase sigma subunit (sigma70/sigma32)